jgi:hypothetical protein
VARAALHDPRRRGEPQVTITLQPDGAGTQPTFRHELVFDQDARDRRAREWTGLLGKTPASP